MAKQRRCGGCGAILVRGNDSCPECGERQARYPAAGPSGNAIAAGLVIGVPLLILLAGLAVFLLTSVSASGLKKAEEEVADPWAAAGRQVASGDVTLEALWLDVREMQLLNVLGEKDGETPPVTLLCFRVTNNYKTTRLRNLMFFGNVVDEFGNEYAERKLPVGKSYSPRGFSPPFGFARDHAHGDSLAFAVESLDPGDSVLLYEIREAPIRAAKELRLTTSGFWDGQNETLRLKVSLPTRSQE